ncbi:uncharacterized protein LOC110695181 [Chenopodium quinoa]|uniref:uncharacterized protein LOC110695181 n=1 Tax=Chenopodium quinoa TaxID=63459 RepID=UPI000B7809BE|nr:uncharacterized protein LOC110695181 [Chenopodium quinoa]
MGSLEEEKLLEMVHDFIESSDSQTSSSHNFYDPPTINNHAHFLHSTRFFTLQEILRKKTGEERHILERVERLMKNKIDIEKTSRVKKWVVKCLKLEGICASLCHTSWVTTPSCPCGNYEYIEVVKEDDAKGRSQKLIVDIDFKSQFEVARPTQSYTQLTSILPIIFVGNEDQLNRIISLLCSAAQESLKERGLHIPPWRRPTYVLSKWKLSNSTSYNHPSVSFCSSYSQSFRKTYKVKVERLNWNEESNSNNNYNYSNNSRLEKWDPQNVTKMKGVRRGMGGGGSELSNQFSNLSINCC